MDHIWFTKHYYYRYIFVPWGLKKGLHYKKLVIPDNNPVLEQAFQSNYKRNWNHQQIQGLAKHLDWSERQVERWLRHRQQKNRPAGKIFS